MHYVCFRKAKGIIEKIHYINIATVNTAGEPWNTPVYAGHDDTYNFYWASWTDNEHSKNIRHNPNVFLTIYDSTVPEGDGEGVYIKAKAFELQDPAEIQEAIAHYYHRKSKYVRDVEEFMGASPRRIYKAVPERVWINGDGEVNGKFVDSRVEISLSWQ